MLLYVLIACSNSERESFFGGGEAHASGEAATADDFNPYGIGQDSGSTGDDSGTTATTSPDGPVLSTATITWADTISLTVSIPYTDPQSDLTGGHLYWDLTGNSDLSGDFVPVDPSEYVEGTNASDDGSTVSFRIEGADSSVGWTLGVTPVDAAGNYGARLLQDVDAEG